MFYNEYIEAEMFYSIWAENSNTSTLGYYVCGTVGTHGIIATINPVDLRMTNSRTTTNDWEYHKIIAKPTTFGNPPRFFVSGRNPNCTLVAFTMINSAFSVFTNTT
jgi:hypothetical protein